LGAIEGIGKGITYGLLFSIAIVGGYAIAGEIKDPDRPLEILSIPIGGAIRGLVGIPIGASIGHDDIFLISSSPTNEYLKIKLSLFDQQKPNADDRKIEVSLIDVLSVIDRNTDAITMIFNGKEISIPQKYIVNIDIKDDKTFITVPQSVYKWMLRKQ